MAIPCYNEADTLPRTLASVEAQTLEPEAVLVADGGSTDGTREVLETWKTRLPLEVLDNPDRRQAPGLNRCLRQCGTEFVARLDGHTHWDSRYLERLLSVLVERSYLGAAGARVRLDPGASSFQRDAWRVMCHRFGTGGPAYRRAEEAGEVPSLQSPVYRRRSLEKVGGFREDVPWGEDGELHHRLRKHDWPLYLVPEATLYYQPRSTLHGFSRQALHYGHGRASLARQGIFPDPRHRWIDRLLFVFVFGLVWNPIGWLLMGLYPFVVLAAWGLQRRADGERNAWFPVLMGLMHGAYAWGWIVERFGVSRGSFPSNGNRE